MINDLCLQANYCKATSPLYAALFESLVEVFKAKQSGISTTDLEGFFQTINSCWQDRSFTNFFERPLLLAGALHAQALQGHAPALAEFYASCGGHFMPSQKPDLAKAIKTVLGENYQEMIPFWAQTTIQTNETSRGPAWLLPLLAHWSVKKQHITLIELGCSAGLGLVADGYGYKVAGPKDHQWSQSGQPCFEVLLSSAGAEKAFSSLDNLPVLGAAITQRIGCDLNPLDCRDAKQKRILEALIWPDNMPRLMRLRAAIETQGQYDVRFERGDMVDCIKRLSRRDFENTPMICLFNTVASCYLGDPHYGRLRAAITGAFNGPWADKDCLWIELEMPRMDERLPDYTIGKEQLIKVHQRYGQSGMQTHYFGAGAAHPKEIEVY